MKMDTPLKEIFRINPAKEKSLKKLGLLTVQDILYYSPTRYGNFSQISSIAELSDGQTTNIYAEVISIQAKKTFKTKVPITEAVVKDSSGESLRII
jgi:ATP-dependent DNA helicase RecG